MSKALVMAVYYSSGAFTPRWPAPLPIRIRVDCGCYKMNNYRLFVWFVLYV